ncbi:hypothetical protein T12_16012 [Trichinella patagoniensis]|uniref:Uncharacterized protein n=1 Tax=Trichinella patagoniensis TaxID=990121 RepID=A0A0V0ZV85_9BILA|nr:hypothetical protein T12_16012 [Trichinella patagoniensis]
MPMKPIFGDKGYSRKLQNFMGYRLAFSVKNVKYLKSYFQTTMTEERLNGLAIMCTFILTLNKKTALFCSSSDSHV